MAAIPPFDGFHTLHSLNIDETRLNSWVHLHALNRLPNLTDLRCGNTPLSYKYAEHFRNLCISYLSKILVLNGGKI
jgi:hypothetical protein